MVKKEASSSAHSQVPGQLFAILWAGAWEQVCDKPRPHHACNEVEIEGLMSTESAELDPSVTLFFS